MNRRVVRDVYYENGKRICCGRLTYKNACLIIAALEILYWMYYCILLIFAVIHHQKTWSIVFTSVTLFILTIQIIVCWVAVLREIPRLLQNHLIFLTLSLISDIFVFLSFLLLSVFPYAYTNRYLQYGGQEWNARTFAIVMGSIMIVWLLARSYMTYTIYRYWKLLRALEEYATKESVPLPVIKEHLIA